MSVSSKNLAAGFFAGAIATVTVHELIKLVLFQAGMFPAAPWPMSPAAMTGVPQFVSDMFWGGLWGLIFVLLYHAIPAASATIKGLIFGIIGPAIIGVFILVPLITARFPLFFGGDAKLIVSVLLILAGFGAAMGWLYARFRSAI